MTSAKTPPRSRSAKPRREPSETVFFDDKERLRGMAGAGDRFLILIEQELGVRLSAPGGGQIVITAGDGAARDEAKRVLKHERVAVLQAVQGANLDIRPLACLERARGRHGADALGGHRWALVAEELFPDEEVLTHLRARIAGGIDVRTHRSSTACSQVPRSLSPRESNQ